MAEKPRDKISSRQITRKAIPLQKAHVHNEAASADTDILASNITPSSFIDNAGNTVQVPCLFRIQVQTDTAAVFSAMVTNAEGGAGEMTLKFNAGADLAAGALYIFDMLVEEGDSVNFQFDDDVNVDKLIVQEIAWAVQ